LKKMSFRKLLLIGSLMGLTVSPVLADDNGWFVGVEGGAGKVFAGDAVDGTSIDFGIKAGYYLNANSRAYVAYNRNSNAETTYATSYNSNNGITTTWSSTTSVDVLGAGYDVLLGQSSLKLVAGGQVGLGMVTFEEEISNSAGASIAVSDSKIGLNLGLKVGGLYDITENHKVELGLKAALTTVTVDDSYTKHIGIYAGYSYKF
jgi:hypothetical protein